MDAPSWLEISRGALEHNYTVLRQLAAPETRLAPVVKANAYGHGLRLCAEVFARLGADLLCVNEVREARAIADLGVPIYVLGPTRPDEAKAIAEVGCEVVVSSPEHVQALGEAARGAGRTLGVHIKVETGTNRQGLDPKDARALAARAASTPGLRLAGMCTHLADVEDETEHTFARVQLQRFADATTGLPDGARRHCASSAAHLLFPEARFEMVRPGIACYGMWPSVETRIATEIVHGAGIELRPALTWKTRLAQVKSASLGDYVGYGRSVRLGRASRIAVLPVGYYDGFDRRLSGCGTTLVNGRICPVMGRICMNMCMIDVTEATSAAAGDEVVLLGAQHDLRISAESMAARVGTINYEITTRIHERLPRVLVA